MKDETREAITGSIYKWIDVYKNEGEDRGAKNCPLCKLFYYKRCNGCPIAIITGSIDCMYTPYEEWSGIVCEEIYCNPSIYRNKSFTLKNQMEVNPKAEKICLDEIQFLWEVLEEYDKGNLREHK